VHTDGQNRWKHCFIANALKNFLAAWVSFVKLRIIILIGHRNVLIKSQFPDCSNLTFKRLEEADVTSAVRQEFCWHVSVISWPPLGIHAVCRLHNGDCTITHSYIYIYTYIKQWNTCRHECRLMKHADSTLPCAVRHQRHVLPWFCCCDM
jgi:hypothetical protein